jgi:hypothetical protein
MPSVSQHALDALSSLPAVSYAYVDERHARFAVIVLHDGSELTGPEIDAALAHIPPFRRPLIVRRAAALAHHHAARPAITEPELVFALDRASGRYEPSGE